MDSLGGLRVNVEHVPHAVHTSTRSGTSTKDVIRASPTLGNWKSESETNSPCGRCSTIEPEDVLISCPPAVTAQASGGNEPCVRACPHSNSSVDCMWAQALSRRESLDEGRYFQAMMWRDRASSHKLPMPRLCVGSDRLADFAKSK